MVMRLVLLGLLLGACIAPGEGAPESTTTVLVSSPSPAVSSAPSGSSSLAWRRIPDIPTARSEVAATVFNNEVYVIGGFGGARVVEIFDGQRWRRGPDLPLGVDHPMAAAVTESAGAGAGVYVLGGNAGGPTSRSFRLAPGATAWSEIAAMPGPRSQGAAVAQGRFIYVVGGYDGQRLAAPSFAYESDTGRWRQVAAIPTPRDHLAAALVVGRVCAVGGRRLSLTTNLATLECYDPARTAGRRQPMRQQRAGAWAQPLWAIDWCSSAANSRPARTKRWSCSMRSPDVGRVCRTSRRRVTVSVWWRSGAPCTS
jgi:hypothetical protein